MCPFRNQPPLTQKEDRISPKYRRETVRDNNHRSALPKYVHALLNVFFGSHVHIARRLIQQNELRIGRKSPCERDELALSRGKVPSPLPKVCRKPLGERIYRAVRVDDRYRRAYLGFCYFFI